MLAKQVSKHREIYCTSDTPLSEVFQKMMAQNCVCMPIVESSRHKNIIGTVTEHDICLKTITDGLNPKKITAGRVMNGNFITVGGEVSVEECYEMMKMMEVERLFVVDDNCAFIGILTENELKPEKPVVKLNAVVADLTVTSASPPKAQLAH